MLKVLSLETFMAFRDTIASHIVSFSFLRAILLYYFILLLFCIFSTFRTCFSCLFHRLMEYMVLSITFNKLENKVLKHFSFNNIKDQKRN